MFVRSGDELFFWASGMTLAITSQLCGHSLWASISARKPFILIGLYIASLQRPHVG